MGCRTDNLSLIDELIFLFSIFGIDKQITLPMHLVQVNVDVYRSNIEVSLKKINYLGCSSWDEENIYSISLVKQLKTKKEHRRSDCGNNCR